MLFTIFNVRQPLGALTDAESRSVASIYGFVCAKEMRENNETGWLKSK